MRHASGDQPCHISPKRQFFYYAIADGLRWLFVCHGRWRGLDCVREKQGDLQMEFELLSGCWLSGKL